MRSRLALSCLLLLVASTARAQLSAPTIKGITCDAGEGSRIHIHQHIAIYNHGKEVPIPAGIGIPTMVRCIYWLHTHTPDGIIHVESPADRRFVLGDFFAVWGQSITRKEVAGLSPKKGETIKVWVDGKVYEGDPAKIPLEPHTDIVVQVGPPYAKPKPFKDWNGA